MSIQIDDVLQQTLNMLQDGHIHDKRQLWRDLDKRGINVSYMTLDMALDLLTRARVIRRVGVTTVQVTEYGSQLLSETVITHEYLEALIETTLIPQRTLKANRSNKVRDQKTNHQENHDQEAWIALFAEILRTEGKPLHFTKIREVALRRSQIKQLPHAQHVSTSRVFQILNNNAVFRSLGKGVFTLVEWDDLQITDETPSPADSSLSPIAMFAQILIDAGRPLSYRDLHEAALKRWPRKSLFPAILARLSLQKNSRFRQLDDGLFALTEWPKDQKAKRNSSHKKPSRVRLFAQILADVGRPLHYRDIHQKALEHLPVEEHFAANLAYVSLYSSPRFQTLGDGVFALAEWDELQKVKPVQSKGKPSRAALFAQILADAGKPLHYRDIHQKALGYLPTEEHFSDQLAYISLHGSSRFRLLGNGIYALAEWEHVDRPFFEENGIWVFMICPRPLLPEEHHPRSLFESVVAGIRVAQHYPSLTAQQFLRQMAVWAQRRTLSVEEIRQAFDTWYVTGLLDRKDYHYNIDRSMTISIGYDVSLEQIRKHCLNSLCQRLQHTTTILYLIHHLPPMSPTRMQQFLRDQEGYPLYIEVADYIEFLAAFEAVQQNGEAWQLTPIGEAILQANPPRMLPNFNNVEVVTHEASKGDALTWDDELGLLDL